MRSIHLDCSSGVSGDMLLASLSHALEELRGPGSGYAFLEQEVARLGLDGFGLEWSEKIVGGIRTFHVEVLQKREQPLRTLSDLLEIIEKSGMTGRASERAGHALRLLGEAEAKVHGMPLNAVHFHEIGAVDTIADIVGVMVLLDALEAHSVTCSPVDLGSGFVDCSHGRLPVPAPACAELSRGLITFGSECGMERATPTGLAILRTIVEACGPQPLGEVKSVGYGSGSRSSDEQPTFVRAFVLETVEVPLSNCEGAYA
ncbi:MAG: LarC family nickel insertion protein [Pseudodesulfovibrio sp.]|nr:LarC family nickel insertion protein [Pseudodesulfovibrio sp.]